jgi:hypothetical protein
MRPDLNFFPDFGKLSLPSNVSGRTGHVLWDEEMWSNSVISEVAVIQYTT